MIRKIFAKEWIKNKYVFLSLNILILFPFWIAYFYYVVPFAFPYLNNFINPTDSEQTIIIENTEKIQQKFLLIGRKHKTDIWEPIYDQTPINFNKTAIYTVPAGDLIKIKARSGTKDYDIIGVVKLTGFSYKKDKFVGVAFSVPSVPIKVYTRQFWKETNFKKVKVLINREILLLIILFTATIGILYHIIIVKWKIFYRILFYLMASFVVVISIYLSYQIGITMIYLLL